jgi:hypothetical protein
VSAGQRRSYEESEHGDEAKSSGLAESRAVVSIGFELQVAES